MTMTAVVDAADVMEHVLRLSDAFEAMLTEIGDRVAPEVEAMRAELVALERKLEDVLDNQAADDAMVEVKDQGSISWAAFEAELDRA